MTTTKVADGGGGGRPDEEEERMVGLYVMGFLLSQETTLRDVQDTVAGLVDPRLSVRAVVLPPPASSPQLVELFFALDDDASGSRVEWAGRAQRALGRVLSAQSVELVMDYTQGEACMARLIERRMQQLRGQEDGGAAEEEEEHARRLLREGFWEAYRVASGGRAHHLDPHAWRMSESVLALVQQEELSMQARLGTLLQEQYRLQYTTGYIYTILDSMRLLQPFMRLEEDSNNDDEEEAVQRRHLMEQNALELQTLEDRQFELLHTIEAMRARLRQTQLVLHRQAIIRHLLRSAEETRQQHRHHAPPQQQPGRCPPGSKRPRL